MTEVLSLDILETKTPRVSTRKIFKTEIPGMKGLVFIKRVKPDVIALNFLRIYAGISKGNREVTWLLIYTEADFGMSP